MLEVGAMTAASSLARRGRVRGPLNADDVGAPVRELPDTGRLALATVRSMTRMSSSGSFTVMSYYVLALPEAVQLPSSPPSRLCRAGGGVPFMSLLLTLASDPYDRPGHWMPWRRRCGAAEDLHPIGAGCAERAAVDAVPADRARLPGASDPARRSRRSGGPERGSAGQAARWSGGQAVQRLCRSSRPRS